MGITNEQRKRITEVEKQEIARHLKWQASVRIYVERGKGVELETIRDNFTGLIAALETRVCLCGCGLSFRVLPFSGVYYATSTCDMSSRGLHYSVNGVRAVKGDKCHEQRKEDAKIRRQLFKEAKGNNEQRKDF